MILPRYMFSDFSESSQLTSKSPVFLIPMGSLFSTARKRSFFFQKAGRASFICHWLPFSLQTLSCARFASSTRSHPVVPQALPTPQMLVLTEQWWGALALRWQSREGPPLLVSAVGREPWDLRGWDVSPSAWDWSFCRNPVTRAPGLSTGVGAYPHGGTARVRRRGSVNGHNLGEEKKPLSDCDTVSGRPVKILPLVD